MIAGVEIGVRDLRAAEAFYGGLLGLRDERVRLVERAVDAGGWIDVEDMTITFVDGPVPLELFSFPGGQLLRVADGNLTAVRA